MTGPVTIEPIAPPEPELTPEQMIARAAALRDRLREEAPAAEARGGYSDELHQVFTEAGFYRILQPRRFGGYEFPVDTFFRTMVEISRGDPGIGWCLSLACDHVFHIASFFSEAAQAELMGPDGHFCTPHRAAPMGTLTPTDGGFLVNGTWDYCSGITHSTHFMATAMGPDPKGGERPVMWAAILPRGDYTVLDDWGGGATMGLQASGSNSVVIDGAFVPSHLAEPYAWKQFDVPPQGTPGYRIHGNPMYLGRSLTMYYGVLAAPVVGAAWASLDEYRRLLETRTTSFPPKMARMDSHDFHRWHGDGMGRTEAAATLLFAAGERYMAAGRAWAERGEPFTTEDDAQLRQLCLVSARLAWEAVELLFTTAGTSAAKRDSPLQRYFRDAAMYRTHIGAQYDAHAEATSRNLYGQSVLL